MSEIFVGTAIGCLVFDCKGQKRHELPGRPVTALLADAERSLIAAVADGEIYRRRNNGEWISYCKSSLNLVSMCTVAGQVLAADAEPALYWLREGTQPERLSGFDTMPGREEWFPQGSPIHVRALTATAGGGAIFAAVHVGGIPRSTDGGKTWHPTIAVMEDVHEVKAHPSLANIVAAATACGLCLSQDGGSTWQRLADGLPVKHALAVAALPEQVLFSVQEDPFASRSQIWRWQVGATGIQQVRQGLPEWLGGKVDTAQIAAGSVSGTGTGAVAIVDGAGNLWFSGAGASDFQRIAEQVPYPLSMLIN